MQKVESKTDISQSKLLSDPYFGWSLSLGGLFSLVSLIFLWWNFSKLSPVVPIFYSLPWGEEQLGNSYLLIILFAGSLLLFATSFFIAFLLQSFSKYLAHMLLLGSLLVLVMFDLTLVQIILLMT